MACANLLHCVFHLTVTAASSLRIQSVCEVCTCSRAESSRGGGFASGFVVGGVVFGTLGFLFAPQVVGNLGL